MIGETFGRLTVTRETDLRYHRQKVWECICTCGKTSQVPTRSLATGKTKSCGCLRLERYMEKMVKEVEGYPTKYHPLYNTFMCMKQRCYNTLNKDYPKYGGRGISVCDRWLNSFANFVEDMGERPENTTLDRVRNSGDYEPGNCRWATKSEQNFNKGGY